MGKGISVGSGRGQGLGHVRRQRLHGLTLVLRASRIDADRRRVRREREGFGRHAGQLRSGTMNRASVQADGNAWRLAYALPNDLDRACDPENQGELGLAC